MMKNGCISAIALHILLLEKKSSLANCYSMYSSTAAPPQSPILFAYGSSHGIMTIDKNYDVSQFIGRNLDPHVSSTSLQGNDFSLP